MHRPFPFPSENTVKKKMPLIFHAPCLVCKPGHPTPHYRGMVMTRPRGGSSSRSLDAKQLGRNGPAGTCSARRHPAGQALVCSMKHNSTLRRCARKGVWMPSRHCPQEQDARAGEKYCSWRREVTQRSRVGAGAPGSAQGRGEPCATWRPYARMRGGVRQPDVHQGLTMSADTDGCSDGDPYFL